MSKDNGTMGGKLKLSKERIKSLNVRTAMKTGVGLNSSFVATHCGHTCVACAPSRAPTCAE
jgi:hypothetical protein